MEASLVRAGARFTMDLQPDKSQDLLAGVREQLASMLLKWNDDLNGVVVGFTDERLVTNQGTICYWYPMVRITARAKVLLFRPCVGQHLVGVVNKVGTDYLGLLVMGVFNASIAKADMARGMRLAPTGDGWLTGNAAHSPISVGSNVEFTVTRVHHEGLLTLAGCMDNPDSVPGGGGAVTAAQTAHIQANKNTHTHAQKTTTHTHTQKPNASKKRGREEGSTAQHAPPSAEKHEGGKKKSKRDKTASLGKEKKEKKEQKGKKEKSGKKNKEQG